MNKTDKLTEHTSYGAQSGIGQLKGKTIVKIESNTKSDNEDYLLFFTSNGERYLMYHEQDCCESVYIEDICGDLDDLLNVEIVEAEEVSNNTETKGGDFSQTWTFYKLRSKNGVVTIRWYGESNGYYSEDVNFILLSDKVGKKPAKEELLKPLRDELDIIRYKQSKMLQSITELDEFLKTLPDVFDNKGLRDARNEWFNKLCANIKEEQELGDKLKEIER